MTPRPHPQRLHRPAAPGERLKRPMESFRRSKPRETTDSDPAYLARLRECPCLGCGSDIGCEAAHLRAASGAYGKKSGMGKKPSDSWCLPLCTGCHTEQHAIGERQFWGQLGFNPFLVATQLYEARGDLIRMRATVFCAISQRET